MAIYPLNPEPVLLPSLESIGPELGLFAVPASPNQHEWQVCGRGGGCTTLLGFTTAAQAYRLLHKSYSE